MKPLYLKVIAIAGILSLACTTKVSEWVLLNTTPANYTLIYYHKDPLTEMLKNQNSGIGQKISKSNIRFTTILKKEIVAPYYALYYENRLFSEYKDPKELNGLATSTARERIAKELKAGKLCVMLYLKSGIKDKDDAGRKVLQNTIDSSPFGNIISIVDLSRDDPSETHLISMLLNVESDLKDIREPMLFGIFGRFKALEPLLAKGITGENIDLMIDFLTADCSCLIKDDLPGTDILFTNNWENPSPALVNQILDENPVLVHK